MIEKNFEYSGDVLSLGSDGEGVIQIGDTRAFVPFCLVGEKVTFRALRVDKKAVWGKLTEVHTLSPDRRAPLCPVFEKCGGCDLQHASYPAQLNFKRERVKTCLKKIGGIDAEVKETVPSDEEYAYRNKLVLPVGVDGDGQTVTGFYAPRSHRIVPINECPLQGEWNEKFIAALKKFMREKGLKGYDERSHKGDIRHVVVREIGKKAVISVVAARGISLDGFGVYLDEIFKDYTLLLNINASEGNAIFGDKWRVCKGEGFFYGEDCGVKFKAGANTFLQVNDGVRGKLYGAIVKAAGDKNAVALDLYSGGGMLTAMLAKACRAAYGIEIVKEAVACADELKTLNGLDGKMFNICGKVEDELGAVMQKTAGYKRVIVCDPPRKGMERSVVRAISESGADKVILVSCDPATLARDLGLLCGTLKDEDGRITKNLSPADGVYEIVSVTPFDMFPQTVHVETLVVLKKEEARREATYFKKNS